MLESAGVISKSPHPDSKAKFLYRLTPKGADLAPVLVEVIAWSAKYQKVHPQAIAFAEQIEKDYAGVMSRLFQSLKDQEQ